MTAKELAERRERIATAVVAGLGSNSHDIVVRAKGNLLVEWAIEIADELIAQLDEVDEE